MNTLVSGLNAAAIRWSAIALAVCWQAVVVLAIAALVARCMRNSPPGLRYWVWLIASVKLLMMPLWGIYFLLPAQLGTDLGLRPEATPSFEEHILADGRSEIRPLRATEASATEGHPIRRKEQRRETLGWRAWVFVGWMTIVILQVGAILVQRRRLVTALDRAFEAEDKSLQKLAAELSRLVGLAESPRLLILESIGSPFVCSLLRPTLVLPLDLTASLSRQTLEAVLVHELTHIKRRDLIWDWIPTIARLLYIFHPAVFYIAFRARLERELACDQAAMLATGQAASCYASTLVDVVSRSADLPSIRVVSASTVCDDSVNHDSITS